jgi:small nuclear ribonucleoprotein (snRNP)-like protein
MNLVVDDA